MRYIPSIRKHPSLWCFAILLTSSASACASAHEDVTQAVDDGWSPAVNRPEFPQGDGPVVLVDAAHGNFHKIDGSFAAFAELLRLDGYRVRSANSELTKDTLNAASIYVISNAILGGDDAEWALPIESAFTTKEIDLIVNWVRGGGSLLLIADHMPFPGATADLADEFGIVFLNGFALSSFDEAGAMSFTRSSGLLADHAITRGRFESERVESIASFTGQAFRFVGSVQPLLYRPDDGKVYMPVKAWEHSETTPAVPARGLIQGGVLQFGSGRVAVFGEAAMFTAQSSVRDGVVRTRGLNHPSASENSQFVLNLMHWLSGLLDD